MRKRGLGAGNEGLIGERAEGLACGCGQFIALEVVSECHELCGPLCPNGTIESSIAYKQCQLNGTGIALSAQLFLQRSTIIFDVDNDSWSIAGLWSISIPKHFYCGHNFYGSFSSRPEGQA